MINITEYIYINADTNKVWSYLIDFSKSLSFNRFHTNLELPVNYSLSKIDAFKIMHNFGFGNYEMIAKIIDYSPPKYINLSEFCPDDPSLGFPHDINFYIEPSLQKSKLTYRLKGTYGGKVQDMSFKPILKGVMKEELIKIKIAIESSETDQDSFTSKTVHPI